MKTTELEQHHSISSIAELFKDEKYCKEEICRIRQEIGNKAANERTYQVAFDSLALMLIHCPEQIRHMVDAQLWETTMRQSYAMMRPWYYEKKAKVFPDTERQAKELIEQLEKTTRKGGFMSETPRCANPVGCWIESKFEPDWDDDRDFIGDTVSTKLLITDGENLEIARYHFPSRKWCHRDQNFNPKLWMRIPNVPTGR